MNIRIFHTYIVIGALSLCACHKPLAVVHCLRPDIHYVTKKGYGYPVHHFYSRVICFDEACRKKSAWIKKQKHMAVKVKIRRKDKKNDPVFKEEKPVDEPVERTGVQFD